VDWAGIGPGLPGMDGMSIGYLRNIDLTGLPYRELPWRLIVVRVGTSVVRNPDVSEMVPEYPSSD